jgi:hypothetical protein
MGKLLIVAGLVILGVGLLLVLAPRIPFLGRLPGDIFVRRDGFSLYIPIVTSIILSIVLTIVLNIGLRLFRR